SFPHCRLQGLGEGAATGGQSPAPDQAETLNEIQRHLQRLDNRISDQENGGGSTGSDVRGEVLREVERRLQGSCASCLAGVEGLQRQQAEDRERMRALEKLVTAVDQRNREAVDAVRQHLGHLAGRMPKEDCCSQLDGRVGGLEHRLDALSDSLATLTGGAGGHGPQPPPWTLDRRMSEIEGRVNTTRLSNPLSFSIQLQGALDRVRGSVHACTQICSAPGSQDSQISDILSDLERRVLDNEGQLRLLGSNLHQLDVSGKLRQLHGLVGANSDGLSKLAGEVGELETRLVVSGSAGPPDLARYANHTNRRLERLEQEVEGLGSCSVLRSEVDQLRVQVEACQAACYPSGRRSDPLAGSGGEQLPTPPSPPEEASKPLDGFSVIGGVSGVHLRSLQGELSEVILGFSALNETLAGLQATVEKHQTDLHELGGTKDRIIAEINRVQQEVTEHVSESEERFRGLGHEVQRFGVTLRTEASDCRRSSGSLTERLAKLEGSCEKLEQVSGTLRKVKEGLDKHLTALWGCLRDTNGTLRLHEALLDKIHGNQLPTVHRRLNSLNGSFQALQEELRILSLQDFTGQERSEHPLSAPASANLAVQKHANVSRSISTVPAGR
uniref:Uncharacterized protein n=1 Tax=Anolis carolinensis TaxID=28377 RepID=H9GLN4_ANOCA